MIELLVKELEVKYDENTVTMQTKYQEKIDELDLQRFKTALDSSKV